MVTRGIVKLNKDINSNPKVNLVVYGQLEDTPGAETIAEYPIASVCTLPGISTAFKDGDIVYVCIEDNNLNEPVIMGVLGGSEQKFKSGTNAHHISLKVDINANLPEDTTIGEVSSANLKHLYGLKQNVQNAIDDNIKSCTNIVTTLTTLLENATSALNFYEEDIV